MIDGEGKGKGEEQEEEGAVGRVRQGFVRVGR